MRKLIIVVSILFVTQNAWAMKTTIYSPTADGPSTSVTNFSAITTLLVTGGGSAWDATESLTQNVISVGGELKEWRINLSLAPGSGKSYTFTIRVNGVDSPVTITISDLATSGTDLTHPVSVSAGDLISIKCVPSGTPASVNFSSTIEFESNSNASILIGGGDVLSNLTSNVFNVAVGSSSTSSGFTSKDLILPEGGIVKNLYIRAVSGPGGSATDTVVVYLNGLATSLTTSITGSATQSHDTTHSFQAVAGDTIAINEGTNGSGAGLFYCVEFDPFVLGESIESMNRNGSVSTSSDRFASVSTGSVGAQSSETVTLQSPSGSHKYAKKLYFDLTNAPGSGKSYTLALRVNGSSLLSTTVSDNDTRSSNLRDIVSLKGGDILNMKITPSGTPASSGNVRFGFVTADPAITTFNNVTLNGVTVD